MNPPSLELPTVAHGRWVLADQRPDAFTMIVFYRGAHCPVCQDYLKTLTRLAPRLRRLGILPMAASMDDRDTTANSMREWALGDFPLGHGLTEDQATRWGLYMSTAIDKGEPRRFSEPGLFLVSAQGLLFYAAMTSGPFGRPPLESFTDSMQWVLEHDYPARGVVRAVA